MKTQVQQAVPLGELIAALYDEAMRDCNDPKEVSRLVAASVAHILLGTPSRFGTPKTRPNHRFLRDDTRRASA